MARLQQQVGSGAEKPATGSVIRVGTRDHRFLTYLYIKSVGEKGLTVCPLVYDKNGVAWLQDTKTMKTIEIGNLKLKFNRSLGGWDVVRKTDGVVVNKDVKDRSKEAAISFMENF